MCESHITGSIFVGVSFQVCDEQFMFIISSTLEKRLHKILLSV